MRVCAVLEARGIACWMAPRDVPAGAKWDEVAYLPTRETQFSETRRASPSVLLLFLRLNQHFQTKRDVDVEHVVPAGDEQMPGPSHLRALEERGILRIPQDHSHPVLPAAAGQCRRLVDLDPDDWRLVIARPTPTPSVPVVLRSGL